ncbi:MAG: cysteine hydrolase family protein [Eggerthellaceae bacterium]
MKRLLVVVDYQRDFVDGALGFDGAEKLEGPIMDKIVEYRATGNDVAFTLDTHHQNYLQTQEGKNLPIVHCIEGSPGQALYGRVADARKDIDSVYYKSSFGSPEFFVRLLQAQKVAGGMGKQPFESIEFVGLVSNLCVLSNAVLAKTACPEVPIIVDAACTGAPDEEMNEKALDIMEALQIKVINRD